MKTYIIAQTKPSTFKSIVKLKKSIATYCAETDCEFNFWTVQLKECCQLKVKTNAPEGVLHEMSGYVSGWLDRNSKL